MVPKRQGIKTKVTRKFIIANQNFFLLLHSDGNIQLNSCSLGFPFPPCLPFSCEYLQTEYKYLELVTALHKPVESLETALISLNSNNKDKS